MKARDPIAVERNKTVVLVIVALAGVLGAALFAVRVDPVDDAPKALSSDAAPSSAIKPSAGPVKELDRTGFDRAVLFRGETVATTKTSTPTGPVASLGPLSLVAIVNGEGGNKKAALFGAASNELVLLGKGEKHGAVHVLDVDERGVDLEQDGNRVRLSLVDGPRGAVAESRK